MSMKINIEAVDSTMKSLPPVTTAKARFDNAGGHEETDPIERLRFFCSKAMSGQDWLDVEPFFDAALGDRGTLAAKLAELEGQTDNLLSACHRLALELECLLLDTKDSASVSRWWDSAMAALDEWHKVKDSVSAEQPMNAQPLEAIKRLSRALEQAKAELYARPVPAEDGIVTVTTTEEGRCVMVSRQDEDHRILKVLWEAKDKPTEFVNARLLEALKRLSFSAQTTGGVAGRDDELCSAIEASAKAIAEAEAQQERILQDMHDAGREVDRVMAEAAPKAVRLTEAQGVWLRTLR